jgi:hypothetical protein
VESYAELKAQKKEIKRKMELYRQSEAEELRRGVEKLILEFDDHTLGWVRKDLQDLLDEVDARDSLGLLEQLSLLRVENIALRKTNAELQEDFNTEHNHNHDQVEVIDKLRIVIREVGSILQGAEFCNGNIPCFEECWQCRAAVVVQTMGEGIGHSNSELIEAHERYREALIGIRDQSHEHKVGVKWVHWRTLAKDALNVRKKER